MAVQQMTMTITIGIRWWLAYYIQGVLLISLLTGLDPDLDKVGKWVGKAVYIK